jgi:hypothetical protein
LLLSNAGTPLAGAYLRASTAIDAQAALEGNAWWLQAGVPALVVEFIRDEPAEPLPRSWRRVVLAGTAFRGIQVHLGKLRVEGRERPVWFFERRPEGHSRDTLRRLRINVTRLQTAVSSLRILSDLQLKNRVAPASDRAKRNLQECLNRYLPFLYQQQYMGFPWTESLRAPHCHFQKRSHRTNSRRFVRCILSLAAVCGHNWILHPMR